MRDLKPTVLIFSVFQKTQDTFANVQTHRDVLTAMQDAGLPVIELQGRYAGQDEMSILIQGVEYRAHVERICKTFNQECYLESHSDRFTELVYPDGRRESIGTLTAVSQDEAEKHGAYSYNPIARQHYICR